MAYALLVERLQHQAISAGVASAVAMAMGARDIEFLTVDMLLDELDQELTADLHVEEPHPALEVLRG